MLYEFGKDALAKINEFFDRIARLEKTDEKTRTQVENLKEEIKLLKGGLALQGKIQRHQSEEIAKHDRRITELERENRELKRANEILRKASAFFAQAELDRRPS